jgi:hypothetical protein
MNISVQKLLAKMEEELQLAKATVKEENLREKVYSIKTLCELILDEKQIKRESPAPLQVTPQGFIQQPMIPVGQPKKLVVDEEANGDSLFDF